jgi:hypothetical protein
MLIAIAVPALVFLVGWGIMRRNEDKCMKRNDSVALFARKRR